METLNPSPTAANKAETRISRWMKSARGFSATEIMTVLTAISTLTAVAAPSVDDYVSQARMTKAVTDARAIQVALVRMTNDVPVSDRRAQGWNEMVLMVTPGDVPQAGEGGSAEWTVAPGGIAHVGDLVGQLITNDAGYQSGAAGRAWGGWRGPYIDGAMGADPWGHRYAVNAHWLTVTTSNDTVVLSAGPDGMVNTPFGRDGLVAGGDDVMGLVASGN